MENRINFNRDLLPARQAVFSTMSRAVRFGDGLFETMRMMRGKILFEEYHYDRLFKGLSALKFTLPSHFNREFLIEEVEKTIRANHLSDARIRLLISRGEGSINEEPINNPIFLVECRPVDDFSFNKEGLRIGIYRDVRKSIDTLSNFKTTNYLPTVMASIFGREKQLDECLLLNSKNEVCDAALSNVFWIKNRIIYSPSLEAGGIAGVMRSYLFERLIQMRYEVKESDGVIEAIQQADEVFLTNVIKGIKWVANLDEFRYKNDLSYSIYKDIIAPLNG